MAGECMTEERRRILPGGCVNEGRLRTRLSWQPRSVMQLGLLVLAPIVFLVLGADSMSLALAAAMIAAAVLMQRRGVRTS
jgi:hypothetical protein